MIPQSASEEDWSDAKSAFPLILRSKEAEMSLEVNPANADSGVPSDIFVPLDNRGIVDGFPPKVGGCGFGVGLGDGGGDAGLGSDLGFIRVTKLAKEYG